MHIVTKTSEGVDMMSRNAFIATVIVICPDDCTDYLPCQTLQSPFKEEELTSLLTLTGYLTSYLISCTGEIMVQSKAGKTVHISLLAKSMTVVQVSPHPSAHHSLWRMWNRQLPIETACVFCYRTSVKIQQQLLMSG